MLFAPGGGAGPGEGDGVEAGLLDGGTPLGGGVGLHRREVLPFVQHLVLWVGFLGAALAARDGTMLALATGTFLPSGYARDWAGALANTVAAAVSAMLCVGAYQLVMSEREAGTVIAAGITTWMAQTVLPFAFGLIALRTVSRSTVPLVARAIAACGLAAGAWLLWEPAAFPASALWPLAALLVLPAPGGTPIFAVLGGLAVLLFLSEGVGPSAVLIETYQLAVKPTLASIPLFTLCGFLLAEGKAPERLLNVFRAWFGWFPTDGLKTAPAGQARRHRPDDSTYQILLLGGIKQVAGWGIPKKQR